MKKVATIFVWVFMFLTVFSYGISMIVGLAVVGRLGYLAYLIPIVLCAIFGMVTVKSLAKNEKKIWIGVCNIIFCGAVGGILYLIWNPTEANPTVAVQEKGEDASRVIENKIAAKEEAKQPEESVADQLLKLKGLKDLGAITEEEYEEKRAALMKKL